MTVINLFGTANYQPQDADLTAYAGLSDTGFLVRAGSGSAAARKIAVGPGLVVANDTGVAGDPTISPDLASQAEAEAGTSTAKLANTLRVKQAMQGGAFLTQDGSNVQDRTFVSKLKARVHLSDYAGTDQQAFDRALTAAAANGWGQLVVERQYTLTSTTTVPRGVTLIFEKAGSFTAASAVSLVIKEPITAPLRPLFFGSLVVTGIRTVFPEWWGAVQADMTNSTTHQASTDCSAAIQAAHDCMEAALTSNGVYALMLSTNYATGSTINLRPTATFPLRVAGSDILLSGCRIYPKPTFSGTQAVWVRGQTIGATASIATWSLQNFGICRLNSSGATVGLQIGEGGKSLLGLVASKVENIHVEDFAECWLIGNCQLITFERCTAWAKNVTSGVAVRVSLFGATAGEFTGDLIFRDCNIVGPNGSGSAAISGRAISIQNNRLFATAGALIAGVRFETCTVYGGAPAICVESSVAARFQDLFFSPAHQNDGTTSSGVIITKDFFKTDLASGSYLGTVQMSGQYFRGVSSGYYAIVIDNNARTSTVENISITDSYIGDCASNAVFLAGIDQLGFNLNRFVNCADAVAVVQIENCTKVVSKGNSLHWTANGTAPYFIKLGSTNDKLACAFNVAGAGAVSTGCVYDLMAATKQKAVWANVSPTSKASTLTEDGILTVGKALTVAGSDSYLTMLISGATKGIKTYHDSTRSYIVGADYTGVGSYQPLDIGGSVVTLSNSGTIYATLSGGQFGIGTTSPAYKLDVNGRINSESGLRIGAYNAGGNSRATLQTAFNLDNTAASAFMWNYSGGGGELDLMINRDGGSAGGLSIYDFPATSGNPTKFFSITGNGGLTNIKAASGNAVFNLQSQSEGDEVHIALTTGYLGGDYLKTAIVADGIGSYSRANLCFVLNNAADTSSYTLADTRMIITSAGYVGINTTAPGYTLDVFSANATTAKLGSTLPLYFFQSYPGLGFNLYYDGNWRFGAGSSSSYAGFLNLDSGGNFLFYGTNTGNADAVATLTERLRITSSGVYSSVPMLPINDNTITLGSASYRWSTVYAATGTINTSDARQKTPLTAIPNGVISAMTTLFDEIGVYQWWEAVNAKGASKARMHIGLTAQAVRDAFKDEGEDPERWGLFCKDETEDGVILGLRYDQLFALGLAVLARRNPEKLAA